MYGDFKKIRFWYPLRIHDAADDVDVDIMDFRDLYWPRIVVALRAINRLPRHFKTNDSAQALDTVAGKMGEGASQLRALTNQKV